MPGSRPVGSPFIRRGPEEERRLLVQIACQRLGGWTWSEIATYHGWTHKWSPAAWAYARVNLRTVPRPPAKRREE